MLAQAGEDDELPEGQAALGVMLRSPGQSMRCDGISDKLGKGNGRGTVHGGFSGCDTLPYAPPVPALAKGGKSLANQSLRGKRAKGAARWG